MPTDDTLRWHRSALAGENPPVHVGGIEDVQCGWFCRRMDFTVPRSPFVPCRIFWEGTYDDGGELMGDQQLRCEVAGVRRDPLEEWPNLARLPISEAEYEMRMQELFVAEVYKGPQRPIVRWLQEAPR